MTLLRLKSRLAQSAAALALVAALGHAPAAFAAQDIPFSISVDGDRVDSSAELAKAMAADKAAIGGMDIQVKFDGLGVKPILNVSTYPLQVNFRTGEKVRFLGSYNYGAWIDHAEVRIISTASGAGIAPFAVIPVLPCHAASVSGKLRPRMYLFLASASPSGLKGTALLSISVGGDSVYRKPWSAVTKIV